MATTTHSPVSVLESVDPLTEQGPLETENVIVSEVLPPDAETLVVSPRMKLVAVIESELWFAFAIVIFVEVEEISRKPTLSAIVAVT